MTWVGIVAVIIAIAAIAIAKYGRKKQDSPANFPYQKGEALFTPAERSFLGVLKQAVGENAQVFGKVRVADVIAPQKGLSRSDWQKAFNRISSKHFDFLLCNQDDLSVICAVELNDSFHQSSDRKKREVFLEDACRAAEVPLIQIPAKAGYSIGEIREMFGSLFNFSSSVERESDQPVIEAPSTAKVCPKCSSPMVKRVAKKGVNAGKKFWACSDFPRCRHIEAINE